MTAQPPCHPLGLLQGLEVGRAGFLHLPAVYWTPPEDTGSTALHRAEPASALRELLSHPMQEEIKMLAYGSPKCSTPGKRVEKERAEPEGAEGIRAAEMER